jgi:hypothetical protein
MIDFFDWLIDWLQTFSYCSFIVYCLLFIEARKRQPISVTNQPSNIQVFSNLGEFIVLGKTYEMIVHLRMPSRLMSDTKTPSRIC